MNLSLRHYYWRWSKNLVFLSLMILMMMTALRMTFIFYFGGLEILALPLKSLIHAFWLGMRYDLMPLAYITAFPFIILNVSTFISDKKNIRFSLSLIKGSFFLGHTILIWVYVFDYGFYSYFQEHLNILVFGFLEDDTWALLISIAKNYNLFFWLTLIIVIHYLNWKLLKISFSVFDFDLEAKNKKLAQLSVFISGLLLLSFFARGNFSRRPLSIEDANVGGHEFLGKVAVNGFISLNRALKIRKTFGKDNYDYLKGLGFSNWQHAYREYFSSEPQNENILKSLETKSQKNEFLEKHPPHVILVVMESFGSFWNDRHHANFNILGDLKQHFDSGIYFKNFLPAENGTIGSIVSIAMSQPIRPGARFLSESGFMKVKLRSAGHLPFKQSGYETNFVYGGHLGWRDLGKFLRVQGYDSLWGADEIKETMPELLNISPKDLGNEWGIFDEYLYDFIFERIRHATTPQFFLVLTTTNHPPFEYPSTYTPHKLEMDSSFLDGLTVDEAMARKRFTGLQYANQKIADFLNKIRSSKRSQDTLVALTGDHSFWIAKNVGPQDEFKKYAVPFFISIPENYPVKKPVMTNFGSHHDIFPTLFNLSLSHQTYIKTGNDMMASSSYAMNSSGLVASEEGAYHHGTFWKWKDFTFSELEPHQSNVELEKLKRKSEAVIGLTDQLLKTEKFYNSSGEGNDLPK